MITDIVRNIFIIFKVFKVHTYRGILENGLDDIGSAACVQRDR